MMNNGNWYTCITCGFWHEVGKCIASNPSGSITTVSNMNICGSCGAWLMAGIPHTCLKGKNMSHQDLKPPTIKVTWGTDHDDESVYTLQLGGQTFSINEHQLVDLMNKGEEALELGAKHRERGE